MMTQLRPILVAATLLVLLALEPWRPGHGDGVRGAAWRRHVIDDSSRGADGVRLADVNSDGRLDVATGWEEGGEVRVALQPAPGQIMDRWPAVTAGRVGSVEDALLVDLDGDGATDVVSACEGSVRTVFVHWAPRPGGSSYLDEDRWTTRALSATRGRMAWMFCVPLQIDGVHGVDLVAGGKGRGAAVGWLAAPEDPREADGWRWHSLLEAGWIMSLAVVDMDSDGDRDILLTDRKGPGRGCFWLENPGPGAAATADWTRHAVGGRNREVMFLALADLDRDGREDVVVATRSDEILLLRRRDATGRHWESSSVRIPRWAGTAKAVASGDLDLDGRADLVVTCENAVADRSGILWLASRGESGSFGATRRVARDIGGPLGVKYDLVELLDLDGDGDLDALTCEERENLGVVWYENPAR